jgi:hypothetical protein
MASGIRLTMNPDMLPALPNGDPVESTIVVQNVGTTVDQYAMELDGLPTTWYSLSSASVALFPQDSDEAKLVIRPPKDITVKAGSYPFTVTVLSRADPSQSRRAEGILQITPLSSYDLDMTPRKVIGRRGRYTLSARNEGNGDLDLDLEANDAAEECRYRFQPGSTLHLPPGQQVKVQLTVAPRRGGMIGKPKPIDFQVRAKPSRGEAKTVQGQIVHTPRLKSWRPIRTVLFWLLLLAFIAVVYEALGGWNGISPWARQAQGWASPLLCRDLHIGFACPGGARLTIRSPFHGLPNISLNPLHHPTAASAHPSGHYIGTFKDFHTQYPDLVGQPYGDEHTVGGRYASQQTSQGLLIYDPGCACAYLVPNASHAYVYHHGYKFELTGAPPQAATPGTHTTAHLRAKLPHLPIKLPGH